MQCLLLKELYAEPEVNVQNSAYCTVLHSKAGPCMLKMLQS